MTLESRKKKVFVLAGEASGDLHGSHVVRKLVLGSEGIDAMLWKNDERYDISKKINKMIESMWSSE